MKWGETSSERESEREHPFPFPFPFPPPLPIYSDTYSDGIAKSKVAAKDFRTNKTTSRLARFLERRALGRAREVLLKFTNDSPFHLS